MKILKKKLKKSRLKTGNRGFNSGVRQNKESVKRKNSGNKKQLETDENEFAKEYKNFENMLNKKVLIV